MVFLEISEEFKVTTWLSNMKAHTAAFRRWNWFFKNESRCFGKLIGYLE
jgi:hypothetical protein